MTGSAWTSLCASVGRVWKLSDLNLTLKDVQQVQVAPQLRTALSLYILILGVKTGLVEGE